MDSSWEYDANKFRRCKKSEADGFRPVLMKQRDVKVYTPTLHSY